VAIGAACIFPGPVHLRTFQYRGWEIVSLESDRLQVDIVPGKGGDILAVRWRPLEINLLWTSPWGLPAAGAIAAVSDSVTNFLSHYPGGWQTIFPNGGDPSIEDGVELPFHGEACLVPWEWEMQGGHLRMRTRLHLVPFTLERTITLDGPDLQVEETAVNEGGVEQEVMWSHHPAFGAPFIDAGCRIETDARWFEADDERDTPAGDLEPGARSDWPLARARGEDPADLRILPGPDTSMDRFGYLGGFENGIATISNPKLDLSAQLSWTSSTFPFAWYWLEASATPGYPWYRSAYVFAIEPASSYPGQGISNARKKTDSLLKFEPGESRTVRLNLKVTGGGASGAG